MIRFTCPKCHATVEAAGSASGSVACPKCGQRVQVKAPATAPAAPGGSSILPRPQAEAPAKTSAKKSDIAEVRAVPAAAPQPARHGGGRPEKPKRRRREEDEEDEGGSNKTLWIAGGVAGAVLVLGLAGVAIFLLTRPSDNSKQNTPVVQNPGPAYGPGRPPVPTSSVPAAPPTDTPTPMPDTPTTTTPAATSESPATTTPEPPPVVTSSSGSTGQDVYQYALKSAVWIYVRTKSGQGSGSGALIDRKNRIVITNDHVAGDAEEILVFFPVYRGGKLLVEKQAYLRQTKPSELIRGKTVLTESRRDMALIQVDRVPDGVEALPLARESAAVGQTVHSVGNPGGSDGLWVYTSGTVRQVYRKKWMSGSPGGGTASHESLVVETQSPTNPGDSGGPLVNDRGELVGVTHGGSTRHQLMSLFIDVVEARQFIQGHFQKTGGKWVSDARAPMSPRGPKRTSTDIAQLMKNLEDKDAQVRTRAAVALGEVGTDAKMAVPSLVKALRESDEGTRRFVAEALDKIGPPAKADMGLLLSALKDKSVEARIYAAAALGKLGADARSAVTPLLEALKDEDAGVRGQAARALGRAGKEVKDKVVPALNQALQDAEKDVRVAAADGLTMLAEDASDVPTLLALLKHNDEEVRLAGTKALAGLGAEAKEAVPELTAACKNPDKDVRRAAVAALGEIGADAKPAVSVLGEALKDRDKDVRRMAVQALGKIGREAWPVAAGLAPFVRDTDKAVRMEALVALEKIGNGIDLSGARAVMTGINEALKDEDDMLRDQAIATVAAMGPRGAAAVRELIPLLEERDLSSPLRTRVQDALSKTGRDGAAELSKALREEENGFILLGIIRALGQMGPVAKVAVANLKYVSATNGTGFKGPAGEVITISGECDKAIRRISAK